jgi:hypothetical protein
MFSLPASCSSASAPEIVAQVTSPSGWNSSSLLQVSDRGAVASSRRVGKKRLWAEAATTDDWCQGVRELTTAILRR